MAGRTAVSVRVVSNRLPTYEKAVDAAVVNAVTRGGYRIEAGAKSRCPVRTGTLRRSIHTVISAGGKRATVGPSVAYGAFVELGTRRMPARPYLRPAFEQQAPRVVDEIKTALRTAG